MNEEEKRTIENNIEEKFKNIKEKGILNNLTYAECLFILTPENKYGNEIKELSLLKLCEIIEKQQAEIEQLQKEAGYKKCILCGKIYKPNKKDQLYCSKSCCNKVMCKRYKLRKKQKIEKGE